jgi:hypothetical protein
MPKIYRTAQGRTVDIGALITQNERTRAVGNMKVNAKGDIIDSQNQVVTPRNRQVNRNLEASVGQHIVAKSAVKPVSKSQPKKPAATSESVAIPVTADPIPPPTQGLAAALARANQPKENQ